MSKPPGIQLVTDTAPPEEDTPDLTDEEIAKAASTLDAADFGIKLKGLTCSTCGLAIASQAHKLCRRAPHLYSRAKAVCVKGHKETWVFFVDWLKQ